MKRVRVIAPMLAAVLMTALAMFSLTSAPPATAAEPVSGSTNMIDDVDDVCGQVVYSLTVDPQTGAVTVSLGYRLKDRRYARQVSYRVAVYRPRVGAPTDSNEGLWGDTVFMDNHFPSSVPWDDAAGPVTFDRDRGRWDRTVNVGRLDPGHYKATIDLAVIRSLPWWSTVSRSCVASPVIIEFDVPPPPTETSTTTSTTPTDTATDTSTDTDTTTSTTPTDTVTDTPAETSIAAVPTSGPPTTP